MNTFFRSARRLLPVASSAILLIAMCGCMSTPTPGPSRTRYAFWPPYPDKPRIQFLVSYERSTDVEPAKGRLDRLIYGKENPKELGLTKPYGVAMWHGRIYVCDQRAQHVTILDVRNQQALVMGASGRQSLVSPSDIAIAEDGTKYVTDVSRRVVSVFDANDRHVTEFGYEDLLPTGIAVYGDEVFVCNFKKQRVDVLDRHTGVLRRTLGEVKSGPPLIPRPLGIAADTHGNIYVTDVLICKVFTFNPQGKLLRTFGARSTSIGGLIRPKHIAVDKEGILYVVDAAFQNVQLFNSIGQVYTFFGGGGNFPGGMNLPAGITVHEGDLDLFKKYIHPAFKAERLIIVTNQFGRSKVSVYALGELREGCTVKDISDSEGTVPTGPSPGQNRLTLPSNPKTPLPDIPSSPAPAGSPKAK